MRNLMAIENIEKNDEKCNKTDPFKISGGNSQ